jgi:hypothetical protein
MCICTMEYYITLIRYLSCFHLLATIYNTPVYIRVKVCVGIHVSFFLNMYLIAELLAHVINGGLTF